jgi:hypothetical protein
VEAANNIQRKGITRYINDNEVEVYKEVDYAMEEEAEP